MPPTRDISTEVNDDPKHPCEECGKAKEKAEALDIEVKVLQQQLSAASATISAFNSSSTGAGNKLLSGCTEKFGQGLLAKLNKAYLWSPQNEVVMEDDQDDDSNLKCDPSITEDWAQWKEPQKAEYEAQKEAETPLPAFLEALGMLRLQRSEKYFLCPQCGAITSDLAEHFDSDKYLTHHCPDTDCEAYCVIPGQRFNLRAHFKAASHGNLPDAETAIGSNKSGFLAQLNIFYPTIAHPTMSDVVERARKFVEEHHSSRGPQSKMELSDDTIAAVYVYTLETEIYRKVGFRCFYRRGLSSTSKLMLQPVHPWLGRGGGTFACEEGINWWKSYSGKVNLKGNTVD